MATKKRDTTSTSATAKSPAKGKPGKGSTTTAAPVKPKRREQFKQAWRLAKESDPRLVWILPLVFVAILSAFVGIGVVIGHPIALSIIGVLVGLIVVMLIFGRRAESAAYGQIEGQPGAAAAVLTNMRGAWTVTPGIAANRNQDVVHRVLGRCGVVLVGEGTRGCDHRLPALFTQEKRRLQRIGLEGIPITTLIVGTEAGQINLKKLQRHLAKLPRSVKPAQVMEIDRRLSAMGTPATSLVGVPKGPLPRNVKMPKIPRANR